MAEPVLYVVKDHICTITLNSPDTKNAFSAELLGDCLAAFERAALDTTVRVIVLTGAGAAFSAGGNVSNMGREITPIERKNHIWEVMQAIPRAVERIDKPVIAMVNGDAVGGGMDMALMCDMRIASDKARFSEAYVRLGLVPGDGGAYFLPRLTGMAKALELLLTGDFIDATEAARIGIVNRTVPHEKLAEETYALARRIASRPPLSVRMTKRLAYAGVRADLSAALDAAGSNVVVVQQSADHKEAMQAFREKRPGVFTGE
jgi:enoyl-CoA hydratase/carnithine racemase